MRDTSVFCLFSAFETGVWSICHVNGSQGLKGQNTGLYAGQG